jgi:hypothetical protein
MTDLRNVVHFILAVVLFSACTYRFYPSGCEKPVAGKLLKHSNLDTSLSENSGLLWLEGHFWTFNDSGDEPALYQVDPENGSVILKTIIRNAVNVDWEDIAMDASYVYVADVGNNFHSRDTLSIYRISRSKLLTGDPEIDHEGLITLSFEEPVSVNRKGFSSLDCEALLVHRDSLYLFTKDWVEQSTSVYVLPATPGHHHLKPSYRYEAHLLVTGVDFDLERKEVALVGYRNYMPVVIKYDFLDDPGHISCGGRARYYPLRAGRQVEGICFDQHGSLYLSTEQSFLKPVLFRVGNRGH